MCICGHLLRTDSRALFLLLCITTANLSTRYFNLPHAAQAATLACPLPVFCSSKIVSLLTCHYPPSTLSSSSSSSSSFATSCSCVAQKMILPIQSPISFFLQSTLYSDITPGVSIDGVPHPQSRCNACLRSHTQGCSCPEIRGQKPSPFTECCS